MNPVPLAMFSPKVSTRFEPTATPVASSEGVSAGAVGAVVSTLARESVPAALVLPAASFTVAETSIVSLPVKPPAFAV